MASSGSSASLDYFGVHPECGCVSAWMSAVHSTDKEIRQFYAEMASSDREVRRMALTDELRAKLDRCSHQPEPEPKVPDPIRYKRVRDVSRVYVTVEGWNPRRFPAGEVRKWEGAWWATEGWFNYRTAGANDGCDPQGTAKELGPFAKQREAAEALLVLARKRAKKLQAQYARERKARVAA